MSGVAVRCPADPTAPVSASAARAAAWRLVQATLFAATFHNWYGVRRRLLGLFGARMDPTARVRRSCRISCPWNLEMGRKSALGDGVTVWSTGPVRIGPRTVVSQYCQICAFTQVDPRERAEAAPIEIGADAWIAAESVVCGGAVVPAGVVVGARSVVAGEGLSPWTIAAGQPARSLKDRPYEGPRQAAGE